MRTKKLGPLSKSLSCLKEPKYQWSRLPHRVRSLVPVISLYPYKRSTLHSFRCVGSGRPLPPPRCRVCPENHGLSPLKRFRPEVQENTRGVVVLKDLRW